MVLLKTEVLLLELFYLREQMLVFLLHILDPFVVSLTNLLELSVADEAVAGFFQTLVFLFEKDVQLFSQVANPFLLEQCLI